MARRPLLTVSLAFVLAVAALVAPLAVANPGRVTFEADEGDNPFQRTCIPEAIAKVDGGGRCPRHAFVSSTQPSYPPEGYAILDGFAYAPVAPLQNPVVGTEPIGSFAPLDRASNGNLPPILLPGINAFRAWYGLWLDENGDQVLDVRVRPTTVNNAPSGAPPVNPSYGGIEPGNEYVPADQARVGFKELEAFIEPGSRPPFTSDKASTATEPDFRYGYAQSYFDRQYRSSTFVPMLDGSLLEPIVVESVSDPVLYTDETTGKPYRVGDSGLVDIDTYVAAVGALTPLYQSTVAPVVRAVATPSAGMCPNACVFPPLIIAPPGGALATVFGNYEREVDPALASDPRRASTAAGRLDDFQTAYRGWIDVMATYTMGAAATSGTPFKKNMPLPGKGVEGGVAVLPGTLLSVEAWSGVWKDHNRDGYIGAVDVADPHEGGNHPHADRYRDPRGEFIPWQVVDEEGNKAALFVTLTPDTRWGDLGVHLWTASGIPSTDEGDCTTLPNGGRTCAMLTDNVWWRDDRTIRMQLSAYAGQSGHWASNQYLWFPEGTLNTGFTLCTELRSVLYEAAGVTQPEPVRDCDYVERLDR